VSLLSLNLVLWEEEIHSFVAAMSMTIDHLKNCYNIHSINTMYLRKLASEGVKQRSI